MPIADSYRIGTVELTGDELVEFAERGADPGQYGRIVDIEGPFDGKINSIYRFITDRGFSFILRARISRAFRYEDIVKEKILFPFIDGKLDPLDPKLGEKIEEITARKRGSYTLWTSDFPVKIPNLLYYDETREDLPYIYAIYEYIPGTSFYYILENDRKSVPFMLNTPKYIEFFRELGRVLGHLHKIEFDGFYADIRDIGNPSKKMEWADLFGKQVEHELREAEQHENIKPLLPSIRKYLEESMDLIADENKAVVFHNDFQAQNFIVEEKDSSFELKGIIDFDNWRVGPPAQDFVKIQYWTIKKDFQLNNAFFEGYRSVHPDTDRKELQRKIDIYKMLWFVLVFNFEMDKIKKRELNAEVDARFPSAEKYLTEIRILLAHEDGFGI